MIDHKARIQAQFGASAEDYVTSATHAAGADLEQLVAWTEGGPEKRALDVATGGGHTALALAPHYGRVIATDLTARMLATARAFIQGRGARNVAFQLADAEALPFGDAAFDLVTCRIAPHHFARVERFAREVARVLKPGGVFLLEDSIVPGDPALAGFLNQAEALRDPTHVRTLSRHEWRDLLTGAGLRVEAERVFPKTHGFTQWVTRARTPEANRRALVELFRSASPAARAAFRLEFTAGGEALAHGDEKALIKARKG